MADISRGNQNKMYRTSTIGSCLDLTLKEMVSTGEINEKIKEAILNEFDKV